MKTGSIVPFAAAVILAVFANSVCAGGTYSGGTGEPNDPYRIATANDLNDIGNHIEDFNKCFVVVNDINLADYNGTQFNIIGDLIHPFRGIFDGNSHAISNFTYQTTNANDVGLFGDVNDSMAIIRNLTLIDPYVNVASASRLGSLIGHLENGTVTGCDIVNSGGSYISGPFYAGGLVGYIKDGNVSNCNVDASIEGEIAGGLAAVNKAATISNCSVMGSVLGTGSSHIAGGLLWRNGNEGIVSNCYSATSVSTGNMLSGGLVTINYGAILDSCAISYGNDCGLVCTNFGTISECHTSGSAQWAGLVGFNENEGIISNCYSTVTVDGNNFSGGLVSGNRGEIWNCYATGTVDGNDYVGGFVAYNAGPIVNCYSSGHVIGEANVGGYVGFGEENGTYTKSFWDSDVNPDMNGIGNGSDPNVIGKPTAEMQMEATFVDSGWDFVEVWDIGENQTYPFLRAYPPGDLNHDGLVNFADVAILADHWLEEE